MKHMNSYLKKSYEFIIHETYEFIYEFIYMNSYTYEFIYEMMIWIHGLYEFIYEMIIWIHEYEFMYMNLYV